MRNWVPERMALKTHPEGMKGFCKDNLSRVAGVEVDKKETRVKMVAGVKIEERKSK